MKTTVDLPDNLLIEAKKLAAEQRRPLRTVIADGLRRELERSARSKPAKSRRINWDKITVAGGLPVDVSDRRKMGDWILRQR